MRSMLLLVFFYIALVCLLTACVNSYSATPIQGASSSQTTTVLPSNSALTQPVSINMTLLNQIPPLQAIRMVNANNGWSLTTQHAILKTTDGGYHWQDVTPKAQTLGLNVQGEFLTAQTAWVAWQSGPGYEGQNQSITILHTTDGGANWQATTINNATGSLVDPPRFINTQDGWLVTYQPEGMMHGSMNTYQTTNGGQTWTNVSGPVRTTEIISTSFSNAQLGWAGLEWPGNKPMVEKTEDGGHSWQQQSLPAPVNSAEIGNVQTTAAVLIGANGLLPAHITVGSSPQTRLDIYTTHDTGATWTAGALANFDSNDVYALDAQHVWAEETKSNALHFSSDGGKTWVQLVQTPSHFDALSFVDTNNGWAIDDAGHLYQTTNSGTNWKLLST
jgi:photosystem II stability/assembly factor-like uncharacterized protein